LAPERKTHHHFRERLHDAVDGHHVGLHVGGDVDAEAAEPRVQRDGRDRLECEAVTGQEKIGYDPGGGVPRGPVVVVIKPFDGSVWTRWFLAKGRLHLRFSAKPRHATVISVYGD
jgi:hypothetical protein